MKRRKLKSLKGMKNRAWNYMSTYVRLRDNCICITCGHKGSFSEMQAGHFVHVNALDFDEKNINCQCVGCNCYRHGNLGSYAVALDKKYGPGTAESLLAKKHEYHKFTRTELESIVKSLEQKIKELK